MNKLKKIFKVKKPVIGMIHLPPLPGYKEHKGMNYLIKHALRDLKALEGGGIDGVMIENEFDHPHQVAVGPEIIAAMTKVVDEVVRVASVPVGLEVLLNDPKASLAIAKVTGAKFIRTDYFVDRMARDEYGGEMQIDPGGLMNYRAKIKAEDIAILTDIQVKYAKLLEIDKPISKSTQQAVKAGSDAVIISGVDGGQPEFKDLSDAKAASQSAPVVIGSGFRMENAVQLLQIADMAIVGRVLKDLTGYMNKAKVARLMKRVRSLQS